MIKFYGKSVDPQELLRTSNMITHPWPENWTRIEIELPDNWTASDKVVAFIKENIEGKWGSFVYDPLNEEDRWSASTLRELHGQNRMVICFESEEDATLFKLMGGHEAWEEN